jgi:fluoroquinolone transport system permease protein
MKMFFQQFRWQLVILARNNIILLSIVVTAIYAIIFYALKGVPNMEKVLTLLILNDPAIIGLFVIGVSIIIERNQKTLDALMVTPVSHHVYILSRVLALTLVAWICTLGMGFALMGLSFNIFHFSGGVIGISLLACLAGVWLVCYTSEFMRFILKTIPVILFVNLPLLNYFNLTDISLFRVMPIQGSLDLIVCSYTADPALSTLLIGYATSTLWIGIIYFFTYRAFLSKLVNA